MDDTTTKAHLVNTTTIIMKNGIWIEFDTNDELNNYIKENNIVLDIRQ